MTKLCDINRFFDFSKYYNSGVIDDKICHDGIDIADVHIIHYDLEGAEQNIHCHRHTIRQDI